MSATSTGFDHPAIDAIGAIETGLDALADAPLWSLPTAELARLVVRTQRLARRLDAALVRLTNQADVAGVAEHQAATSLPAWLRAVADEEGTRAVIGRATEIIHRFAPEELEHREVHQAATDRLTLRLHPTAPWRYAAISASKPQPGCCPSSAPTQHPDPASTTPLDPRDTETRYADALLDICQAASN